MNIFLYGTLMIPEVLRRVTGRAYDTRAAVLHGFARLKVKGESYPALLPFPDMETDGIVVLDVGTEALSRLDAFEGELYQREEVTVEVGQDEWLEAETFVIRPAAYARLSAEAWDEDEFRELHLRQFMRDYPGFGAAAR
jgi:gamma-glutamylcyclotransferase (GGCT)/AIG2-like uncharacterized protein YtfP